MRINTTESLSTQFNEHENTKSKLDKGIDKNIWDSIKDDEDSIDRAKRLVEQAGFKVKRAWGSEDEPYVTIAWDGSYSDLQKKVRQLRSAAKSIGYDDVYVDDDDICFSKW